jgi:hypothetical protein
MYTLPEPVFEVRIDDVPSREEISSGTLRHRSS